MSAETISNLMDALDPVTVKGIGQAMTIWQQAAIMAMQAQVVHGQQDAPGIAKRSVAIADALVEEIIQRTPGRMESFLKME